MKTPRIPRVVFGLAVVAGLGSAAFVTRDRWQPWFNPKSKIQNPKSAESAPAPIQEAKVLKMTPQARKNLGLVAKSAKPQTYWRTIQVPGAIVDRPGRSDRGVTAPAVGAVVQIHAFPGDTVKSGDRLFTLRVFSEYLQNTQSELFKATRETQLLKEQQALVAKAIKSGAVAEAKAIELDNQLRRQSAAIQAYRQDLLTRGLNPEQIEDVTEGNFVSTIEIVAPPQNNFRFLIDDFRLKDKSTDSGTDASAVPIENQKSKIENLPAYEVQELKVELGQQVQAGQLLTVLANHHSLYIEGHAFKQEAPFLERAAQNGWPIEVEFAEDDSTSWPSLDQTFHIRHLANSIDTATRTFDFFIPLTNQSRGYQQDGQTFMVWRFRPGQRVRLHVPVEQLNDVLVLPSAAVVREGPEAYVFQQNGDLFNRIAVHALHEDHLSIVLANDGSIKPGLYLAQNAAASLNRVLKAQAASGIRADVHVHADGTVHAAH